MIRWIVIALFIYLMLRLFSGPKRTSRHSNFKIQFGSGQRQPPQSRQRKQSMDQIEEAEYEDITETNQSEHKEK